MTLKRHMWFVIGGCALVFFLNKHFVRPWVLDNFDVGAMTVFVNSLPNFIEAIIGMIDCLLVWALWKRVTGIGYRVADTIVYTVATLVAGPFVIASELNWIQFRGPNVYDPLDVTASVLGLILINRLVNRFGFAEYKSQEEVGHSPK